MPRIPLSVHGSTPHERLLGHNQQVLKAWLALEEALFRSDTFNAEMREQMRRALAFGNQCEYCMRKAGPPDSSHSTARLGLAVAFAALVGQDHRLLDSAQIDVLREEFTDAEIAELTAFVCFITASQMVGAILGLGAADLPGSVLT